LEAVVLCLLGGLIGVLVGAGASWAVSHFTGWPIFIGLDTVLFAMAFAAAIGVFFGWYPARKAARLAPVEALTVE
jgi:putative ABC transport system permease protein